MTTRESPAAPLAPVSRDPSDESAVVSARRERVSGTRVTASPPPPADMTATPISERVLVCLSRALVKAAEAPTDGGIATAHLEGLLEALPGRAVAIRVVNPGTRAVEIARSSAGFIGGADLVLRMQPEGRKCVLEGTSHGFDLPLEVHGDLLGAISVEHPARGAEAEMSRDLAVATLFARQLSALLTVGRQRRGRNAEQPRRMIPLTPVATVGFGNELRALFDGTRELIALLDRTGTVRTGNAAMAEALAVPPDRLAGRTFIDLIEPSDRRRMGGSFWSALRGQASNIEVAFTPIGGEENRLMALSFSPVRDASGMVLGAIVIGRDVTDQRLREEQFARADKLASVGRLAASVVHEINNPLTAILAYSEQLGRSTPTGDSRDATRAARITEAAERIRSLVRRLLAYTPSATEQPSPLSLGDVTAQAWQFCEHVLRDRGATLELRVASDTPPVYGLRGELSQVFVNLITNACHATPQGSGRIEVEVLSPEAGVVRATVRDNGHGIAQKDLARVFEPFYTTKGNGQGTGLGLSIVRSILEQHRAALQIESTVGVGTTFTIDFPAHAG
ncbi:MAG: ATP-binding protein [Polyangiales bacterium]